MSWDMHEAAKRIADGWYVELEESRKRNAVLGRENAKLRELVKHLRECTKHNVCVLCDYKDDVCDFDYDMRELGIEVNDV